MKEPIIIQHPDRFVDLHTHTKYSDGTLTPTALVEYAKKVSLDALAITDHDTVDGINEAAIAADGLEIIPGVELSACEGNSDVHILGYYIYTSHAELLENLHKFRSARYQRAQRIVDKLNQLGISLVFDDVLRCVGEDTGSIGRPHVAQALIDNGFVATIDEAFHRYLGHHAPAYIPKWKITATDAIRLIRNAGGLAVLAHPSSLRRDELIPSFVTAGLGGLEAIYPGHSETVQRYYTQIAGKHGLVVTGGTDYHGPQQGRPDLGSLRLPYTLLATLRQRWKAGI